MANGTLLTLLPFPQAWDGTTLELRILALPQGDPLAPPLAGAVAFADADLHFEVSVAAAPQRLPDPADAAAPIALAATPVVGSRAVWEALAQAFTIVAPATPANPRPLNTRIRKWLTPSYRQAFHFDKPRTPFAVTDDSYKCALSETPVGPRTPGPGPTHEVSWARVVALALRHPLLAARTGLLYTARVPLASLGEGAWIWVGLAATSTYAPEAALDGLLVGRYAARLPPLGSDERALFAAVLFPVTSGAPGGPPAIYDEAVIEAEAYDDGFAKIVHGHQPRTAGVIENDPVDSPPTRDLGIRLGWDDEQIAIWMNRQLAADPVDPLRPLADAPFAVRAYRVDVREQGEDEWHSLTRVEGQLAFAGLDLGAFDVELGVEAVPAQLAGRAGDFWLPSYFTAWAGASLVVPDVQAFELAGHPTPPQPAMQPVRAQEVPLRYGGNYEFRVRLMDLSGGGPLKRHRAANPAQAPVATCRFRRWVPPKALWVTRRPHDPQAAAEQYVIHRPLLGYPDALFAGAADVRAKLLADVASAREQSRETGVADPDVEQVFIAVDVATPAFDVRPESVGSEWIRLYTTRRALPIDPEAPLLLDLEYVDNPDVAMFAEANAETSIVSSGALVLPTARDVRLTFVGIGHADPTLAYFGSERVRSGGAPTTVRLRSEASDERRLFADSLPTDRLRAVWLRPDPVPTALTRVRDAVVADAQARPVRVADRLADAAGLDVAGLTYSGKAGERTTFGCGGALRHVLAPDSSSIAFASEADLINQWVVVVCVDLARDWTWNGLAPEGIAVERVGAGIVGNVRVPRSVAEKALLGAQRDHTRLVFFDAIDPKPAPAQYPREIDLEYVLHARFVSQPVLTDTVTRLQVRLPIATPPRDTPRIASVGWALSPYARSRDYGETAHRERALWIELEAAPADSNDRLFARLLGYGPDPMLCAGVTPEPPVEPPIEPPLPIDSELVRVITSASKDDRAGLDTMELLPTASPRHFLLRPPAGLSPAAAELLGFFVYELRFGHAVGWSMAQPRFGAPLRVNGLQHPPPPLDCRAFRSESMLTVSAPYARPVGGGRSLQPRDPATELWVLLYAQVTQLDGQDRRNVLLDRRRAQIVRSEGDGARPVDVLACARWEQQEISRRLYNLLLAPDSSLSALAVELLPTASTFEDPLGADLGQVRILRVSALTRVPAVC